MTGFEYKRPTHIEYPDGSTGHQWRTVCDQHIGKEVSPATYDDATCADCRAVYQPRFKPVKKAFDWVAVALFFGIAAATLSWLAWRMGVGA